MFQGIPDKFCLCGIRAAMLAGGQHPVSVGNRLKRHNPGGKPLPSGYITESGRDGLLPPQIKVLQP